MADNFQLKALITGVDKLSPTLAGIRKNVSSFRKGLQRTGLGNLSFRDVITGGALAAPFVMGTRAAIQFESAMADVRKVVNFDAPSQFKEMGDDITKMSERLPMAANDIAKIVAAGGQSGIARGELLGFAEDAVKMGIAFDQTAEQSGDMMAKWRTSFKMTQAEVVGLADKINYLGNTGPANTKQISDIVTRVGPLGEVAGVASGQIAAMGATMAGVGVEQEVAATGIKNFMLALTKGSAATKSQATAFQALRLDSKAVAAGMQKDAQGTMVGVLKRIAAVDATKRPALLSSLFGTESIGAIAPLLTNLGLLESNLKKTGDAEQYAGSMEAEYASRAATTENNLTLMRNAVTRAGIALGNAFLPPLNAVVNAVRPFIGYVSDLIQANPALVRGLAAAGVAFTAIRVAALAAMVAARLLSLAFAATPIGIAAVAIAAAAGLIITYWEPISSFFSEMWSGITRSTTRAWARMRAIFRWTPLGQIVESWQPLMEFFSALWGVIRAVAAAAWDGIKSDLSAVWGWIKEQIGFDPVQIVSAAWDPLVSYFKGLFDQIRPFIQPLMNAGDWANQKTSDISNWVEGKAGAVKNFFSSTNTTAATTGALRNGTQELRQFASNVSQRGAGAFSTQAQSVPPLGSAGIATRVQPGALLPAPGSLLSGASNKSQLNGELVIRLEGETRGVRPQPATTDQPGLKVSTNVGYRSLSGAQ
jgi:TP901 family phage tail tape measure protein